MIIFPANLSIKSTLLLLLLFFDKTEKVKNNYLVRRKITGESGVEEKKGGLRGRSMLKEFLSDVKREVKDYLKLCKDYIKVVIGGEPEVKDLHGDLVDGYNVLWDIILAYLDDLKDYIQARKRVISEFEAHLFWVRQVLEADSAEDAVFYLKHAIEDLIDMKSSAIIERDLASRVEEQFSAVLKVMEGVKAARRRAELFEETYPKLEKSLENMIKKLKELEER